MTTALLTEALTAFGAVRVDAAQSADARSGAGVHQVQTSTGEHGYVKVTPAVLGKEAIVNAERELRFYRQVAATVPVATPAMLNTLSSSDGVALLLSDAGAERPSPAWTDQDWSQLGRDIAGIHSTPLPKGEWTRPDPLGAALAAPDLDQIRAFWAPALPDLEPLLAGRGEIIARLATQPSTFVHGDCHTGNILHTGRGLAFCDWQSTGLGRATADLAFLSVRATPAGVDIPSALVRDYLACRPADGDPTEFKRDVLLEELAIYIFEWPPYAAYNDSKGVARVQRRARALADHLGGAGTAVGGDR